MLGDTLHATSLLRGVANSGPFWSILRHVQHQTMTYISITTYTGNTTRYVTHHTCSFANTFNSNDTEYSWLSSRSCSNAFFYCVNLIVRDEGCSCVYKNTFLMRSYSIQSYVHVCIKRIRVWGSRIQRKEWNWACETFDKHLASHITVVFKSMKLVIMSASIKWGVRVNNDFTIMP